MPRPMHRHGAVRLGWRWPILLAMLALTVLVAVVASGTVSSMLSW